MKKTQLLTHTFITTIILIESVLFCKLLYGGETTCSRVAEVNFQEILVDRGSAQKGEGLKFFLDKDPVAKSYFDAYQKGNQTRWINATLGTVGSLMIISGIISTGPKSSKNSLLIAGSSTLAVNFLVAKTIDNQNEKNLHLAIDEYNKRNLPRIKFDYPQNHQQTRSHGLFINFTKDF